MDINDHLNELDRQERALSMRLDLLHDRINFIQMCGGGTDQLQFLRLQEREISFEWRKLHAQMARLRDQASRSA